MTVSFAPQNLDYEIMSGARRQERRWDPAENDQVIANVYTQFINKRSYCDVKFNFS